jgi:hypothetical protein
MTGDAQTVIVTWQWQRAGQITLGSDDRFVLPLVPKVPGIYQLTLTDAAGQCAGVYVGMGGSLHVRLQNHKTPGTGHRDTKTRVNGLLLSALRSGGTVAAEIATFARSAIGGRELAPLDLTLEASRGLVENAALTVAYASGLAVLNGRLRGAEGIGVTSGRFAQAGASSVSRGMSQSLSGRVRRRALL